jgi:hypothetical protein
MRQLEPEIGTHDRFQHGEKSPHGKWTGHGTRRARSSLNIDGTLGSVLPSLESLVRNSLGLGLQLVVFAGEFLVGPFLRRSFFAHLAPFRRFRVQHVRVEPAKLFVRLFENHFDRYPGSNVASLGHILCPLTGLPLSA